MRFHAACLFLPLVLAVPVTASRADTPSPPLARHHVRPVSTAQAPVPAPQTVTATPPPAAVPAPPAQLATPAPVASPDAKPPTQSVGAVGVPPSPTQTR